MPAFVTFGQILFAVLFMYTGATKLFAVQQTADFIATKVTIPAVLAPYTSQLETMTGMPMPQLLALGGRRLRDPCGPDDRGEFRRAFLRDPADLLRARPPPSISTISGTSRRPTTPRR